MMLTAAAAYSEARMSLNGLDSIQNSERPFLLGFPLKMISEYLNLDNFLNTFIRDGTPWEVSVQISTTCN